MQHPNTRQSSDLLLCCCVQTQSGLQTGAAATSQGAAAGTGKGDLAGEIGTGQGSMAASESLPEKLGAETSSGSRRKIAVNMAITGATKDTAGRSPGLGMMLR